jgi:hypothetical protein
MAKRIGKVRRVAEVLGERNGKSTELSIRSEPRWDAPACLMT